MSPSLVESTGEAVVRPARATKMGEMAEKCILMAVKLLRVVSEVRKRELRMVVGCECERKM